MPPGIIALGKVVAPVCHDPGVGGRNAVILLSVISGLAVLCGGMFFLNSRHAAQERSQNDRTVHAYLDALASGDYNAAYALICTDETGVDRGSFEQVERENPLRAFEIKSSVTWSSPVDGHGRVYLVGVTRNTVGETVEEVRTQGADSICIQYASIRQQ